MFKFVKLDPIFRRKDVETIRPKTKLNSGLIINSKSLSSEVEANDSGELLPLARSGHRAFFHTGVFYIIGGFRGDDFTLTDVWRYYPLMHHWEKVQIASEVPEENLSCASFMLRDRVFQFGGSGAQFGFSNSDKLFCFDLGSLTFSEIENKGNKKFHPHPSYGNSLAYSQLNECLYLCCGTNGRVYHGQVHKFNLNDGKWSILPQDKSCVTARYRQESFVWRNSWFIIGGSFLRNCHDMSCMYKFCFATEKWELINIQPCPIEGYPNARRGFGSVMYGDRLYIFGGSHFKRELEGNLIKDEGLWYIELNYMRWSLIQKCALPKPVDFFAIAVDEHGKVLLHGGRDDLKNNLRSVQTYIIWLDVPPLIELCWEKIKIWQKEGFFKLSLSQLMSYGLPRKHANQVHQFYLSCMT